jgi:hypothetical protein
MNESDLILRARQRLADFDHIGPIQPSEVWKRSLSSRLVKTKKSHYSSLPAGLMLVIIFLFLINLGFILNSIMMSSASASFHTSELQIISNQLLINPTSLK